MNITLYTQEHYNALLDIFRQHVPEYFAAQEEKDLIMFLDNHVQNFYVCKDGDIVVGCGGHNIDGTTGKLSWYMTHAQYMGKGIGKMLVQYNLEKLKGYEGINRIIVRTSQLTDKFYEPFGFKLIEVEKDYWAEGLDLYEMELSE